MRQACHLARHQVTFYIADSNWRRMCIILETQNRVDAYDRGKHDLIEMLNGTI